MDSIFESWLVRQNAEVEALAAASDIVFVHPDSRRRPPRRFLVEFESPTLVELDSGIARVERYGLMVAFPPDYLRQAYQAAQVVMLLAPLNVFHPNARGPFLCTGALRPGTGLCEILYQIYEILSYARFTSNESDALNAAACEWARRNTDKFPLDTRPLRRRTATWSIDEVAQAGASA